MTQYDNRNRFTLFKNERRDRDTSPEYNGTLTDENGVEFWVSAWVRESKNGKKFFSGSIKRKEPLTKGPEPEPQTSGRLGSLKDQLDDSIPFMFEWR
jgi:hypothetical protein